MIRARLILRHGQSLFECVEINKGWPQGTTEMLAR